MLTHERNLLSPRCAFGPGPIFISQHKLGPGLALRLRLSGARPG